MTNKQTKKTLSMAIDMEYNQWWQRFQGHKQFVSSTKNEMILLKECNDWIHSDYSK